MAYRQPLYISPTTLTDLTVIIIFENSAFPYHILTLDDFTEVDNELYNNTAVIGNCTFTIYSSGYQIETFNVVTTQITDKHITLTPTVYCSNISDGSNTYYIKDNYSRQLESNLLEILSYKADTWALDAKLNTADVWYDSTTSTLNIGVAQV